MITGLDHATIWTSRLEETRAFFEQALGLEVGFRPAFNFPGYWLYGDGAPLLHLVGNSEVRPAGGVIDHVSFATSDFEGSLARLDRFGVKYRAQSLPDNAGAQAFCSDPNGAQIEITWRNTAR